jgi:L-lactate dehydrogenase complex protein LldF
MGAALTPALAGLAVSTHLPNASTFCGRCEAVCPVAIPIPKLLRHWRERALAGRLVAGRERRGLGLWRWLAAHPRAYRLGLATAARLLRIISVPAGAGGRRRIRRLPAGNGWTGWRDLPAPEGETFQERWRRGAGASSP